MSVFRVYLSLVGAEENITEPPDEALELDVIAGVAHLTAYRVGNEALVHGEALWSGSLPAHTLLRYLKAAIREDADDKVRSVLQEMNVHTVSSLEERAMEAPRRTGLQRLGDAWDENRLRDGQPKED